MPGTTVCVTIVTCNSAVYIRGCLEAVLHQRGVPFEVVVVDNASTDGTLSLLAEYEDRVRVLYNERNVGFAAGQNLAIAASRSEWVLTLNPDVLLAPAALRHLVEAGDRDGGVGAVCGRLLGIGAGFTPLPAERIDSAGMYFTPSMRHFDRGWHEPDDGRYRRAEYVFGASAAAALYRRRMIDDVADNGEFFDPDFFIYREDADVAWRAQLLGWRTLYIPAAVGHHVRSVGPRGRGRATPAAKMHSVKNRFLMRVKNITPGIWRHYWAPMLLRDLVVVGGCLLWEHSSLAAFWHLARSLRRALERRRRLMARRRVDDDVLVAWFEREAAPLAAGAARLAAAETGAPAR